MSARKCISVAKVYGRKGEPRCVCERYITIQEWKRLAPEVRERLRFEKLCKAVGARYIGTTDLLGGSKKEELGGFDMAKRRKKGKRGGAQAKKFKSAAKSCKGLPLKQFRSCMKKTLKGKGGSRRRKSMSSYDDISDLGMPSIEEYSGLDGLGQYVKSMSFMPSKNELVSVLVAAGGAGAAFFGVEYVGDKVKGMLTFIPDSIKNYVWTGLKLAGGVLGGKFLYNKVHPDLGTGVGIGLTLSAVKDVLGYTGLASRMGLGAWYNKPWYPRRVDLGLPAPRAMAQVDMEEEGRLADFQQVDVEEHERFADIYGYQKQIGLVDVVQ